jgi:phage terminase small subunit
MSLTEKQKRFADEYIKTGNATQAAIDAGYSKKTARSIGSENLTKPDIKEYIDARLKLLDEQSLATQKEVLQTLASILRREQPDYALITVKKPETIEVMGAKGPYEKIVYADHVEKVPITTKVSDVTKASELLLRIFNAGNTSELTSQRIEQTKANTELTKARASLIKGVKADTSLLDALVDALNGGGTNGQD